MRKKFPIWDYVFGITITVFLFGLLFLAAMLTGCTSQPTKAAGTYSTEVVTQTIQEKLQWQEEVIRSYNNLVHRIWIDRPTYFEECLTEGDEYAHLTELFNGDWGDTFTFYSIEDSLQYYMNWDSEAIYTIKRVIVHDEEE